MSEEKKWKTELRNVDVSKDGKLIGDGFAIRTTPEEIFEKHRGKTVNIIVEDT